MDARSTVQRYLTEALDCRGATNIDALVADESLARRSARFRAAFPDLEVSVVALLTQDDLVATHLTGRGTHRGVFLGCPPTGRAWEARCTAIYQVRDDRIVQAWVTWDLLTVLEQLGAVERGPTVSA